MKKLTKRIGISILGFLQGTIGSYFALLGFAFAFPESSPGSKDYEEDMFFVPFGYLMILIWLIIMVCSIIFFRKNKGNLLSFLICWGVGLEGCLVYTKYFH